MEIVLIVLGLLLALWVGVTYSRPAKKVRVLYLSKDHQGGSYIRFRPNPAINIGDFHFCTARKRSCQYRKTPEYRMITRQTERRRP